MLFKAFYIAFFLIKKTKGRSLCQIIPDLYQGVGWLRHLSSFTTIVDTLVGKEIGVEVGAEVSDLLVVIYRHQYELVSSTLRVLSLNKAEITKIHQKLCSPFNTTIGQN